METNFKAERGEKREILITPKEKEPEFSLIWMHGLGDSAEGFLPLFISEETPVTDNFRVRLLTAPESPVTINMGMRCNSWYDIFSLDRSPDSLNYEDVNANSEYVQSNIDQEVERFNGDSSKVLIGGFSQGCAMAVHNGLIYGPRTENQLGAIIGCSGYLFPKTDLPKENPPTLLCHGAEDPMINVDWALESYQRDGFLGKRKNVEWHKIKYLDHGLNLEVVHLMRNFIKKIVMKK